MLSKENSGLSTAELTAAFVPAIRSTPQPPFIHSSFARQIICGGFAGYLLLSGSHLAVVILLGFYPHNRKSLVYKYAATPAFCYPT